MKQNVNLLLSVHLLCAINYNSIILRTCKVEITNAGVVVWPWRPSYIHQFKYLNILLLLYFVLCFFSTSNSITIYLFFISY